jgi:hypothetical protein
VFALSLHPEKTRLLEFGRYAAGRRAERGQGNGQLTAGVAEIGPGENNAGGDDADADLGDAGDGEREGLSVQAAGGTKLIAGNDHGRIPGQSGRIRRVVLQQRGGERAGCPPKRQADQEHRAVLSETGGQHDDGDTAGGGANHAEPPLAQRGAETRLTHDCRRGASPGRAVEFQPERDVECEANGRPQP